MLLFLISTILAVLFLSGYLGHKILPNTELFSRENIGLRPMPVCIGDPEAPNLVYISLCHEFKSWVSVAPNECSVYVLVPDMRGFFHPEDVEEVRRLKALNPELRIVEFDRFDGELYSITLLEVEANVGVA